MLSFKWFKLWGYTQTNWVDFVRMEFFNCFLKYFIIINLIHRKECVYISKHNNKMNIHKSTTQTKNQNTWLYTLHLPEGPLPVAFVCLFYRSNTILNFHFIFPSLLFFFKWLWSFVFTLLTFWVTQFLWPPSQSTAIFWDC